MDISAAALIGAGIAACAAAPRSRRPVPVKTYLVAHDACPPARTLDVTIVTIKASRR